jgi:anti-sigma regulatory factor (Ser/Thr protein kinase)
MDRSRVFEADPARLADVRKFIIHCARGGPFESVLDDLLIAASEASANAVLHSGTDEFTVSWHSEGHSVEITVQDHGLYERGLALPEIDGKAHRGLHLMARTMSEISIRRGTRDHPGTKVRMVKVLPRASGRHLHDRQPAERQSHAAARSARRR